MANTPYVTTDNLLRGADLVAVATTTPTTSAYGFTLAQATAIITQLNAVIALLQQGQNAVVSANGL